VHQVVSPMKCRFDTRQQRLVNVPAKRQFLRQRQFCLANRPDPNPHRNPAEQEAQDLQPIHTAQHIVARCTQHLVEPCKRRVVGIRITIPEGDQLQPPARLPCNALGQINQIIGALQRAGGLDFDHHAIVITLRDQIRMTAAKEGRQGVGRHWQSHLVALLPIRRRNPTAGLFTTRQGMSCHYRIRS